MNEFQKLQLPMLEAQEPSSHKDGASIDRPPIPKDGHNWHWWLLVAANIVFLLVGQAVATLLGRFYFNQGGKSKWMATLVQTAAFPILVVPLFLFPSSSANSSTIGATTISTPPVLALTLVYITLGLLLAGDNMMYSIGLFNLPVSTYSLICATQLAFNAIFSFFINSLKFTSFILNSVILLTLSASLLAIRSDSTKPTGVTNGNYVVGFICTLSASAMYALLLSLVQLSFQKVLKKETFSVVLEMQIYTSLVATFACIVGLFVSGEWSELKGEMDGFKKGRLGYVMVLVWTAVAWQICSVGVVGLVFVVSSLYSNVISTFTLALAPLAAVVLFHENMDGVKLVAMLLAIWGFASYIYQNYLDESKPTITLTTVDEVPDSNCTS